MKLSDFAKETGGTLCGGDAEISSLCTDSRVAGEGDLFFCFRGTHEDSHEYAEEAERRGVAAIVCEHDVETDLPRLVVKDGRAAMAKIAALFYGHPERGMKIVGVTGTNGKTTVAHMLYSIFSEAGKNVGLIGTLGARYGGISVPPELTTPDPVNLFSLLADMRRAGVEVVAMEVSAHALALRKVLPIRFAEAVFTNLTQDHLDFFGDMEKYGRAKAALFTPAQCREAVLNTDDAFARSLLGCGVPCRTYGLETPADHFALVERETIRGARILLNLEDELVEAELGMTGRHNVYNALAAATAARAMGVSAEAISRGLSSARVEGRLERVASVRGAEIFVDFAHTPDGLEKSLCALREHCKGRLIVLFGCGGNRDRGKRPKMGEIAARHADFSILTSDNPRYEDPVAIIAEIEAGFRPVSENYLAMEDREAAIGFAISRLKADDVLLIAGKGGEREQEIMGIKYSYNDKDVIESILGKQS